MQALNEIGTAFAIFMIWVWIISVIVIGFDVAKRLKHRLVGEYDPARDGDFDQQEIARRVQ